MKSIELTGEIIKTNTPFAVPLDAAVVNITPVQSGSGDPSPTNVRPISGWTGAKVTRCSVNLFDLLQVYTGTEQSISGTTISKGSTDYSFDILNGTTGESATVTKKIFLKSGTYTISGTYTGVGILRVYQVGDNNKVITTPLSNINASVSVNTFTLTADGYITLRYSNREVATVANLQINIGSTATDYEPYTGTTYDITFPSEAWTVYGGTLDVTTGLLTVTMAEVDLGTLDYSLESSAKIFYSHVPNMEIPTEIIERKQGIISSMYPVSNSYYPNNSMDDKSILRNAELIYIRNTDYISATAFKAAMSGVQLVYQLATPQTYQLTPTQVALLAGENNVWADCGDIAIAYRPYHRFDFDGVNSIDNGVYVFPTDSMIAAPARQYTEQVVPGRSGVLLMDDGRYDNVLHEYQVVTDNNGQTKIALLRNMLASRVGYCRLVDTFDPDHYYIAVYNQNFTPVLEWRKRDMAKAVVSFYRKPQRFLLTGESAVVFTTSGSITNPTRFKSKPFIRVYGSGVLGVGSTNITIASHGYSYMDIDCETGRAYNGATSLDSKVTLNAIDFPALNPGSNGITKSSGITRIEITPRWWEL